MTWVRPRWADQEALELGDLARRFFDDEVVPHLARFDQQQQIDREVWTKAGALGLLCCSIPSEYGGGGGTFAHDVMVFAAQYYAGDTSVGNTVHSGIVCHYLNEYGTEEQKRRWLPRMATGELVGAIAMTEPGAGSDLKTLTSRAVRAGNGWRISGAKTFISNGALCDLVIVAAKTDPDAGAKGVSLFVLETEGAQGFRRGRVLDKLGLHGQDTSELFFDDVHVPEENLLGQEGQGFSMLMNQLPRERLVIGVTGVSAMERALAETVAYAKSRTAFGGPLLDLQGVRLELAELATVVQASRVFADDCVEKQLEGRLDPATAAMAKWWLTENQCQVVDRCLQVFGGYGYMREYLISRLYADARVQKIYGGANEIMKELIGRSL